MYSVLVLVSFSINEENRKKILKKTPCYFFFSADGSVYQTGSLNSLLRSNSAVYVEAEYTGSELEPVYDMKVMSSGHESGYQRIACAVRDGKVKIY